MGRWNEGRGRLFRRDLAVERVGRPALPDLLNRSQSIVPNKSIDGAHPSIVFPIYGVDQSRVCVFRWAGTGLRQCKKKKTGPTHYKSFTEVWRVVDRVISNGALIKFDLEIMGAKDQ